MVGVLLPTYTLYVAAGCGKPPSPLKGQVVLTCAVDKMNPNTAAYMVSVEYAFAEIDREVSNHVIDYLESEKRHPDGKWSAFAESALKETVTAWKNGIIPHEFRIKQFMLLISSDRLREDLVIPKDLWKEGADVQVRYIKAIGDLERYTTKGK
jgi:hypothetical protein